MQNVQQHNNTAYSQPIPARQPSQILSDLVKIQQQYQNIAPIDSLDILGIRQSGAGECFGPYNVPKIAAGYNCSSMKDYMNPMLYCNRISAVAFADCAEEVLAARAIELWKSTKDERILVVPPYIRNNDNFIPLLNELLAQVPVIYDAKENGQLFTIDYEAKSFSNFNRKVKLNYSGEVPSYILELSLKERFSEIVLNSFWYSQALAVQYRDDGISHSKINSRSRLEVLANGLLLDYGNIHFSKSEHQIPKSFERSLGRINFTNINQTKEYKNIAKTLELLEDIIEIWKFALENFGIVLNMNEKELDDQEKFEERMKNIAEFVHLDDYMQTYLSGVSVEDIIL